MECLRGYPDHPEERASELFLPESLREAGERYRDELVPRMSEEGLDLEAKVRLQPSVIPSVISALNLLDYQLEKAAQDQDGSAAERLTPQFDFADSPSLFPKTPWQPLMILFTSG